MGSPLAPVLANFFMGHYEKLWFNNYTGPKVLYYRRFVDDIICCFKTYNDARFFLEYLYSCHLNIKFTMETEEKLKVQLPFLCGLHEVYSHIMVSPDLFIYLSIYLSTRVERLSRGLV